MLRIGTAGWTIPAAERAAFPSEGTQLERYAAVFNCVEINSSFYRPHRSTTYGRWAASVPDAFAFALKVPKEITHVRRCADCDDQIDRFLDETAPLGSKRGVLLVQLPPSFEYDGTLAGRFFDAFRERYDGMLVCEPRHPSWFTAAADAQLRDVRVARAAADPAICSEAATPGGWTGLAYYRLHGSPRMYYSSYGDDVLDALTVNLAKSQAPERWAIFDNTASGAATGNALALLSAAGG